MMDLHRALLSCICRLCGTRGHEIAASKLTPKCNLSRDIYSSLDIDINEDSQDIHPPSICDTCRLKVSRWKKNKYNRKKDLQPPNITIHEFSAHDDACQVCAERQWDAKIVADFLQQQGMFSWNEEGEVVGVVVDRGGNGILKKVSVKGQNIDCFVLGKRVEIPFKSMEDVATKFLDASICPGNGDFQELAHTNLYCGLKSQSGSSIATVEKGFYDGRTLQSKYTIRHANCQLILPQSVATASNRSFTLCKACLLYRSTLQRAQEGQKQRNETKAKFVPTKFLSPDELREKVGQLHQEKTSVLQQNRRLKERIEQSLKEDSVEIIEEEAEKLSDIVGKSKEDIQKLLSPGSHCHLLWKQQMEAASKPAKQMRWHPAVLRWAIAIHMKSASAYSIVREAGYLSLPHPSTLYKYTHFTNPHTGINSELLTKFYRDNNISSRKKHEKYVALLMDEMKISSGLAFSRSTGRLIGFCDIGSISSEMEDFEKRCTSDKTEPVLASHVLLFMARGITTSLKFPVAYYATASLKASQLHEMTYEVITALKLMDLTVLCLVSDGAASNRRLYQNLGGKGKTELSPAHFCWNWFGDEEKIFFICDVPHLLKTLRNNMENSNWSRKTRNLVFRGQKIQWTDLISFMEWDQGRHRTTPGLRFAPKLTHEHLYLTPGLRMKVRLAAQVMSNTVANGLELMKRKELGSAILFLRKVNKFFDCLNVARLDQGTRCRNENLKPYTSEDDPRFEWLLKDFLGFLTEWATEGETIEGLTKKEKAQLCISRQTIAGVYITVHSFTEIARKLLRLEGVRYVLSDKLNQDPIEEFFGKQRGAGGHHDNPTLEQFGHAYVRNIVAGSLVRGPARGNVRSRDATLPTESEEPLQKRKKPHQFGFSKEAPL